MEKTSELFKKSLGKIYKKRVLRRGISLNKTSFKDLQKTSILRIYEENEFYGFLVCWHFKAFVCWQEQMGKNKWASGLH